jgi:hypothetical protein
VGSTQLAVPGVQLQPRSELFWSATREGNKAWRNRHQTVPSAGHAFRSQCRPRSTAFCAPPCRYNAWDAREVAQQPWGWPEKGGQEPSARCACNSQSRARAHTSAKGGVRHKERSAASAQAVASTALGAAGRYPHPPSEFCLVMRNSGPNDSRSWPAVTVLTVKSPSRKCSTRSKWTTIWAKREA